mmetsp:Transcript_25218/g.35218  ORF Transcript_25218/g.35218 Transcript_25218/m.35218 type:complete len:150 (+) Transcript_25218:262-711(+)
MWRILFPLSVGFLSLFGDAIGMLVNDSGKLENLQDERGEEGHEFASWLLAGSFSAFLIVNVLQRQLHTIPYTTLLDDSGLGGSAASLRIVMRVTLSFWKGQLLPNMYGRSDAALLSIIKSSKPCVVIMNKLFPRFTTAKAGSKQSWRGR